MESLSEEEQFILKQIADHGENGKKMPYKELQNLCADEFEGVRLILKKMKGKNLLTYEGMIPGYDAIIILNS
ncbi:MAG: hypothetical protein ACTSRK_05045 [Promethearchaeota archaeon]